jgi:hypothetical protein
VSIVLDNMSILIAISIMIDIFWFELQSSTWVLVVSAGDVRLGVDPPDSHGRRAECDMQIPCGGSSIAPFRQLDVFGG